jgi:hypothetical protein
MKNPSLLTNSLLAIIAALLVVQILQKDSGLQKTTIGTESYVPPDASAIPGAVTPAMGDFIFQALRAFPKGCEKHKILAECDSPAALAVKEKIQSWGELDLNPRELFDKIVATYGENALSDEAKKIRAMRKK